MKVTQVYALVNEMHKEFVGNETVVKEDLSNVIDIGKEILGATDVDNYVKKLIDKVGKVIFVNRQYAPILPSVLMDGWEYGSILQKIDCDNPEAEENPKWGLVDGQRYEQDTFKAPKGVRSKFFNDRTTFQVPISYTEDQVKESFNSPSQLNAFFSMIETKISNSFSIKYSGLIRATINNFTAATIYNEFSDVYTAETHNYTFADKSGVRAVNLLGMYHSEGFDADKTLTPQTCLKNLDFLKYASYKIMLWSDRMKDMSVLFNIGKKERFTPKDKQHIVLLSEFSRAADVYLQSDTFHDELTRLPKHETINFWQGTGTDYGFSSTSLIHTASKCVAKGGDSVSVVETNVPGIIGVIFDRDALGVNNIARKTTSHYNANGDFMNFWHKSDAGYFNDYDENFVVFFVA